MVGGCVADGLDGDALLFCEGEERFGGFFRYEDRSMCPRVKDRWSVRLSRSNASVRVIARVLTTWRRSTRSPLSRFRSLRATSRRVCGSPVGCAVQGGVGCEFCCSATCASSRASMVSKASASSRNSSLRPSSSIRWESDRSQPCVWRR